MSTDSGSTSDPCDADPSDADPFDADPFDAVPSRAAPFDAAKSDTAAAIRDAATVLVFRDGEEGPEVFMVRRHQKSGFMGGAFVFPGGTVDEADASDEVQARVQGSNDRSLPEALGEAIDERSATALFVAAVRETLEEAGIWLGSGNEETQRKVRTTLLDGQPLGPLLIEHGLFVELDQLCPFTRWITPAVESRRYDTRFFVVGVEMEREGSHDNIETTDSAWIRPKDALVRFGKGEILLPPPTMRSLAQLSGFRSTELILEHVRSAPVALIDPVFIVEKGEKSLVLPGHPLHLRHQPAIPGPTRFVFRHDCWVEGEAETRATNPAD